VSEFVDGRDGPAASPATSTGGSLTSNLALLESEIHAEFDGEVGVPLASASTARPTVFQLAWPSIATNILQAVVGIVDTAIVGRVSVDAQAAVGSGNRIFFFGQAVMMAVTAGTTALVARAWGAGERAEAERVTVVSMIVCGALGLVFSLATIAFAGPLAASFGLPPDTTERTADFLRWLMLFYVAFTVQFVLGTALRAAGDVLTPLAIGALTNIVNVVLVYALVFGELPGIALPIEPMGVRGAAIATGIAFSVGALALLALQARGRLCLGLRWRGALQRDRIVRIARIGWPAGLEQAVFQGGFFAFLVIVSRYGTAPNAAYNIGVQLLSLSFVVGFAYSIAASTLVGQHLGAGEPDAAMAAGWRCMRLAVGAMFVLGILVIASAQTVAPFFNSDPEVARLTVVFIYVLGLVQPLMAIEFALSGALRGAGDTRWPLISVMSGFLGVRLTLAFAFLLAGFSVEWIYAALIGDYIVKASVLSARFRSGRWKEVRA